MTEYIELTVQELERERQEVAERIEEATRAGDVRTVRALRERLEDIDIEMIPARIRDLQQRIADLERQEQDAEAQRQVMVEVWTKASEDTKAAERTYRELLGQYEAARAESRTWGVRALDYRKRREELQRELAKLMGEPVPPPPSKYDQGLGGSLPRRSGVHS